MENDLIYIETEYGHKIYYTKKGYEELQDNIKKYDESEEYKSMIRKMLYG